MIFIPSIIEFAKNLFAISYLPNVVLESLL